jgi:hypothetical protein
LNEECIHGLDIARCDLCTPKPRVVVEPVVKAAPAARTRQASGSLTSTPRAAPRRSAARAAGLPPEDVGGQRIYHLTHVSNLAEILSAGRIFADANSSWESRPAVDISSEQTRLARRAALLDADRSVAHYVPFSLAPKSSVWEGILTGFADDRLSIAARGIVPADFVILVSTVKHAFEGASIDTASVAQLAVTDGDAASPLTRFGSTRDAAERQLRKLRADQLSEVILDAELLVADEFPFERITLVGVANDRARDVVKAILQEGSHRPKVAVYPPWFRPAEEAPAL